MKRLGFSSSGRSILRGRMRGSQRPPASRESADAAVAKDRRRIGRIEGVLFGVGAALLLVWLLSFVDSRIYQHRQDERLRVLLQQPSGATATEPSPDGFQSLPALASAARTRESAKSEGLVGRIEIPRVRISAVIAEGTGKKALRRAVGRIEGTAFPGERGNAGIAGHRDTFFRQLKDVREADSIRVTTPDGTFLYMVDSVSVVGPHETDVLLPDGQPRLTLVTCYPFYYVGRAPKRYIVHAVMVGGSAQPRRETSSPREDVVTVDERDAQGTRIRERVDRAPSGNVTS